MLYHEGLGNCECVHCTTPNPTPPSDPTITSWASMLTPLLVSEVDQQDQCSPVMQRGPGLSNFSFFLDTHQLGAVLLSSLPSTLDRRPVLRPESLLSNLVFSPQRRSPPLRPSHDRTWQTSLVSPAPGRAEVSS